MDIDERIHGALWGAIAGDALGVPVEFTSRAQRLHDPVAGMRGFGTHGQPPGTWSDDSSLLLCTVEALCEEYDSQRLAGLFLAWNAWGYWTPHGTVFDIGIATRSALTRLQQGTAPEEAGGAGERDNGNGSLMRILPVALRYAKAPVAEMLTMAHRISALTHRHPRSQMACGLYCCLVKALLDGDSPQEAYRFAIQQGQQHYATPPFNDEFSHFARFFQGRLVDLSPSEISSSGYVIHTLEASLWSVLTTPTFADAVLTAVNLGEDTDTTGCVAGGLAGAAYGLLAIPADWLEMLAGRKEITALIARFIPLTCA